MEELKEVTKRSVRKNVQALRALVIQATPRTTIDLAKQDDEPGKPKDLPEDPLEALTLRGDVIEPPFDLLTLATLPEHNSELTPCIESMVENIEGYGYRLVPRVKFAVAEPEGEKVAAVSVEEVKAEHVRLENFFNYVCLDLSFVDFRKRLRFDLETTGNAYFEVIRSATQLIQGFNHVPAYQVRLGRQDVDPFKYPMPMLEMGNDGKVQVVKTEVFHRFRRFVQCKAIQRRNLSFVGGYQIRYFKEFGDPREFHFETGEVLDTPEKMAATPPEKRASEMVHFKLYAPRSPYGLPRFIGNLLSIFGDRAAEEINYVTFRNNNVPSMLVLVSNGQLTEGSIGRLKDFVESQIQGSDNYSKFVIVEAEGVMEGDEGGQVKLDVKPLSSTQVQDAMFQNYSKNNQDRVRCCFRLPPIFVGRSDDYTRATAESSRQLADEQIFAPAREVFDSWVNRILFPWMGIVYHKFKSNSPNTTDNTELVGILSGAERTGGMTPRIARLVLEDILGQELPDFPTIEGFDPDVPFSLAMAAAVKNQAQPTEVGQQVTALKSLMDDHLRGISDGQIMASLMRVRKELERTWKHEAGGRALPQVGGAEENTDS